MMQSHDEVFRYSRIELWCSYNTQCQCLFVWLQNCVWGLYSMSIFAVWMIKRAHPHIHWVVCWVFLMLIMEHVNLFNLVKYYNVVLKTGQCSPSKKYPNAFHFAVTKSTEPYTCYVFKCDILCMLYVVFVLQYKCCTCYVTCTLYLCTAKYLLW